MSKKDFQYEEDREYINLSITNMNARQRVLEDELEAMHKKVMAFQKEHEKLEKKIEKHFKKYGIVEEEKDEVL